METVIYAVSDRVATLTFNRPEKKNAANAQLWREFDECLDLFVADGDARVLVVTGAGDAFCSGADLSDLTREASSPLERMRSLSRIALKLFNAPKPTIARVNGVAAGAGCNIALGCDLIVAGRSARFSEIFARRGLSLDFGGSYILPRLVGLHKAKELAYFAEVISADEALDVGIVNVVVEDGELDAKVAEWAARIVEGPPIALSLTKQMLNDSLTSTVAEALERESISQIINLHSQDSSEAMHAFLEKRKPTFNGR